MYQDAFARFFDLKEGWEDVDGTSAQRRVITEELQAMAASLGENDPTADPLFDKWERELAAGKDIDLEEF